MSCANTEHQFENDIEELMTTELGWTKASERSYLKWGEMQRYSRGIADFRLRLYWPEFKNIKIPCPPLEEQRAIAKGIEPDFLIGCYDVTNAVSQRVRGVRILANHCVDGFVVARPDKWSKFRHALVADGDADYKREVRFGSVLGDDGALDEGWPLHNGEYLIFRTRTHTNEVGEVVRANYGLIEESLDYQSGLTLSIHVNPECNDKSLEHDKAYRQMKKGR